VRTWGRLVLVLALLPWAVAAAEKAPAEPPAAVGDGLGAQAGTAPVQPAAIPPAGLPRGAIIAFMPDFRGVDYSDTKGLRRWLAGQGWAVCDGKDGTPDLHARMLIGTERPEDAGQRLGSRDHAHRLSGTTDDVYGRDRDFPTGRGYSVRIPEDSHRHGIQGQSDRVEHLPPSTQVVFIIKTR
jgi:hypothetical protein